MKAREMCYHGKRVENIRSYESYPRDFGAFIVRLRKFAAGAAELWRALLPRFLRGPATWTEKVDALAWLSTYVLMPVVWLNLFLSGYICHRMWQEEILVLAPGLAYLFLAVLLCALPVLVSVSPSWGHAIRHWFWAQAVYSACLPITAVAFLFHIFRKPEFIRTPKRETSTPIPIRLRLGIAALGVGTLALACLWLSPFSPLLGAVGLSCGLFPLFACLNEENSWAGKLSRVAVYLPGMSFITGLVWMWLWATSY